MIEIRRRTTGASVAIAIVAFLLAAAGELRGRFESSGSSFDLARSCRDDVRVFSSLKSGDFDFCRQRLGYTPGRAECLRVVTITCADWAFDGMTWLPREIVSARTERIACPPGPAPPSCPSNVLEPAN
jgi:hypothetical protein